VSILLKEIQGGSTGTKKWRKNLPSSYTRHHRRPKSLGGASSDRNISIVLEHEHRAWTRLFDNLPALKVQEKFEEYWKVFRSGSGFIYKIRKVAMSTLTELELLEDAEVIFDKHELLRIRRALSINKSEIKKAKAWRLLFGRLSLEQMVAKVNNVWIDPDYELVIVKNQTKDVAIRARGRPC
jgi:hypothetical protein